MTESKYDFRKIEKKWQNEWEKGKVFEANPDKGKKKFFLNFAYPYINLSPHIGHFYTAMRTEAFARYKRLQGFNVLFPQGWHATGSPIVAAANRVKEGEPKQIQLLKNEGFSDKEIKKFSKPEHWIEVFGEKWEKDLKAMGLSIDWRRNFITTSMNPYYDKFIRWQFNKLREKGLVEKGEHPVVWDPKTNMPVGDHDRTEGEGEVPQEMLLFKFNLDGKYLVSATLRPDTVMGITNLYVNPSIEYVEIEVNGETWIIGKPVVEKLRNQNFNVNEKRTVKGKNLVGKKAEFMGREIPVLPADFIDPEYGTGIVHSVPSESADDLIALQDLQKNKKKIKEYGLNEKEVNSIKPVDIFDIPGIKGFSAQYYLDKYSVKNQNEKEKLEKIRKELYTFTFSKGKYNEKYEKEFSGNLKGKLVSEGQEIIKNDLLEKGIAERFYELTGKVVSRSLTPCIVKIVKDQWFIKYGDEKWKEKVHDALKDVRLYPELVRSQFEYVIGWINDWACTREYGLGTRLPFDEKWLIEALSDSTIYMAYYTIAHKIKEFDEEELGDEFFDYIFLGKGNGKEKWKKLKEEFEYWYPVDFRNSGKDLVQNHLTFFLFNHVAIFPKKHWPKGIGVNGWVKVDGRKMSKSLGNVIPLYKMANEFGSDASRLTILSGGEGLDDPNWDTDFAKSLNSKFLNFYNLILENYGKGVSDKRNVDKWAESVFNKNIKESTEFMEETLFRSAIQRIFFNMGNLIKDYLTKTQNKPNKKVFETISESFLIMLSPFTPHFAEELWSKIGKKNFVSFEKWPLANEKKIDDKFEKQEEAVEKLISDINIVKKLIKEKEDKEISKGYVYVLPNENSVFEDEKENIENKTDLSIKIFSVSDKDKYDPENKSSKVKPGKPGIYLE